MSHLRSAVLRIASELPKGDPTRRKILSVLAGLTGAELDKIYSQGMRAGAQGKRRGSNPYGPEPVGRSYSMTKEEQTRSQKFNAWDNGRSDALDRR